MACCSFIPPIFLLADYDRCNHAVFPDTLDQQFHIIIPPYFEGVVRHIVDHVQRDLPYAGQTIFLSPLLSHKEFI